ncbi:STAR protein, homodimerization region [Dillenia turbinata]|uniref:STAR protein, homodimerization region n=1 Tax=Dillenia turbinata TaxID=194707 RepID=A0AAN8UU29_9MAGN
MDDRIPPGSFFQYPPLSGVHASPHRLPSLSSDRERYIAELLAERQKLGPFLQVLPLCSRLLNQEIIRASGLVPNKSLSDFERFEQESPLRTLGQHPNGRPMDLEGWSAMQTEENGLLQRMGPYQASAMGWHGAVGIPTTPVVRRVVRLDVPVDKYPNYNFVGRLLGPRGNSLKRVEATTHCRVYIRGQGSVKDAAKEKWKADKEQPLHHIDAGLKFVLAIVASLKSPEENLKDKPGYEHLNEPLHVLVEAECPEEIINARIDHAVSILENLLKPVDESLDQYKKQQLRELALLNGTFREESPSMSPSMSPSPFNTTGMKRAKTGR